MNKTLEEYAKKFGKFPPRVIIFSYDNEEYIKLMKKAIEEDEEITPTDMDEYLSDKNCDLA